MKDGHKRTPNVSIIFSLVHHSLCLTMCLPMNLNHSELYEYAELLVIMQGASGIGVGLAQFGKILNIKTESGLTLMFYSSFFNWAILTYVRGIHYFYTAYKILSFFWSLESKIFFYGSCVGCLAMTMINLFFVKDINERFIKFWKLYFAKSVEEGDPNSEFKTKEQKITKIARRGSQVLNSSQIHMVTSLRENKNKDQK